MTEAYWGVLEPLKEMASEKEVTLSQLALAWVMAQPGVTCPIIGPRTMEQLEDNLKAIDVLITDDDRKKLDAICAPGRMFSPFYEADFGPHLYR